jgi:hypothetical protein
MADFYAYTTFTIARGSASFPQTLGYSDYVSSVVNQPLGNGNFLSLTMVFNVGTQNVLSPYSPPLYGGPVASYGGYTYTNGNLELWYGPSPGIPQSPNVLINTPNQLTSYAPAWPSQLQSVTMPQTHTIEMYSVNGYIYVTVDGVIIPPSSTYFYPIELNSWYNLNIVGSAAFGPPDLTSGLSYFGTPTAASVIYVPSQSGTGDPDFWTDDVLCTEVAS